MWCKSVVSFCTIAVVFGLSNRLSTPQTPKLIGGEPTDISLFPHQLSLRFHNWHVCGASILSDWWALTSVTCLDFNPPAELISFLAGATNKSDEERGFLTTAIEYFYHPDFNRETHSFDVCVVRVRDPFIAGTFFKIPVSSTYLELPVQLEVTASGWGVTDEGVLPDILHKITLDIVGFEECNEAWDGIIDESMICAGRRGVDVCGADAGGALVYCGLQVGITLFSNEACDGSKPSVYVNLGNPRVRGFIRQTAGV